MNAIMEESAQSSIQRVAAGEPSGLACTCEPRVPNGVSRRGLPGNDATRNGPAISMDDTGPWARHAQAANGFGDGAVADTPPPFKRATSYDFYHAARIHRAFFVGELIAAAISAIGAFARRALARHRQRRCAMATYGALQQLDDRALRDLGFDRSETKSLAAEVTREAASTRVRALQFRC